MQNPESKIKGGTNAVRIMKMKRMERYSPRFIAYHAKNEVMTKINELPQDGKQKRPRIEILINVLSKYEASTFLSEVLFDNPTYFKFEDNSVVSLRFDPSVIDATDEILIDVIAPLGGEINYINIL